MLNPIYYEINFHKTWLKYLGETMLMWVDLMPRLRDMRLVTDGPNFEPVRLLWNSSDHQDLGSDWPWCNLSCYKSEIVKNLLPSVYLMWKIKRSNPLILGEKGTLKKLIEACDIIKSYKCQLRCFDWVHILGSQQPGDMCLTHSPVMEGVCRPARTCQSYQGFCQHTGNVCCVGESLFQIKFGRTWKLIMIFLSH